MANPSGSGSEQTRTQTQQNPTIPWIVGARLIDLSPATSQPYFADPHKADLFGHFSRKLPTAQRAYVGSFVTGWSAEHEDNGRRSKMVVRLALSAERTRSEVAAIGLRTIAHALVISCENTDPMLANQEIAAFTLDTQEMFAQQSDEDARWNGYGSKVQPGVGLNAVRDYFRYTLEHPTVKSGDGVPVPDIEFSSAALLYEQFAAPASPDPLAGYRLP